MLLNKYIQSLSSTYDIVKYHRTPAIIITCRSFKWFYFSGDRFPFCSYASVILHILSDSFINEKHLVPQPAAINIDHLWFKTLLSMQSITNGWAEQWSYFNLTVYRNKEKYFIIVWVWHLYWALHNIPDRYYQDSADWIPLTWLSYSYVAMSGFPQGVWDPSIRRLQWPMNCKRYWNVEDDVCKVTLRNRCSTSRYVLKRRDFRPYVSE